MSDWKLLNTSTASGASSVEFTDLTGYKIFKFVFVDIHVATDDVRFGFQTSIDGGSNYNTTITSTSFSSYHNEADNDAMLTYNAGMDLAQATTFQCLTASMGTDSDQQLSGEFHLFNPASTTYVKHWTSRTINYDSRDYAWDAHLAGYVNDGSNDLTNIKFYCNSGNFDGVIKQYGLVAT